MIYKKEEDNNLSSMNRKLLIISLICILNILFMLLYDSQKEKLNDILFSFLSLFNPLISIIILLQSFKILKNSINSLTITYFALKYYMIYFLLVMVGSGLSKFSYSYEIYTFIFIILILIFFSLLVFYKNSINNKKR